MAVIGILTACSPAVDDAARPGAAPPADAASSMPSTSSQDAGGVPPPDAGVDLSGPAPFQAMPDDPAACSIRRLPPPTAVVARPPPCTEAVEGYSTTQFQYDASGRLLSRATR